MKNVKYLLMVIACGAVAASGGCFSAGNLMRFLGDVAGDALWLGGID